MPHRFFLQKHPQFLHHSLGHPLALFGYLRRPLELCRTFLQSWDFSTCRSFFLLVWCFIAVTGSKRWILHKPLSTVLHQTTITFVICFCCWSQRKLEISIWWFTWDGLTTHHVLWGDIFYKKNPKSHHCKSWRKVGLLKREPCFRESFWDSTDKNKASGDCQENGSYMGLKENSPSVFMRKR